MATFLVPFFFRVTVSQQLGGHLSGTIYVKVPGSTEGKQWLKTNEGVDRGQEAGEGPGWQHWRREQRIHRWDSCDPTTWHYHRP